jgi:hypothetical protein
MWPQYYFLFVLAFSLVVSFFVMVGNVALAASDKKNESTHLRKISAGIFSILLASFNLFALHVGGFFAVWGW